jgi:hypothetical protein
MEICSETASKNVFGTENMHFISRPALLRIRNRLHVVVLSVLLKINVLKVGCANSNRRLCGQVNNTVLKWGFYMNAFL